MTEGIDNPWTTLSNKEIYDNPWIRLTHHDVLNPAGKQSIYGTVHFKRLAIGIIPLDEEGNTWIVGQYRFPINTYSWEIPEGGGDREIEPVESAQRELREECGIIAGQWLRIQEMHMSNSATDEYAIIYLAKQLSFTRPEPDEDEQLSVRKIPFTTLYEMVCNGEITDSITVAAVLKLQLMRLEKLI